MIEVRLGDLGLSIGALSSSVQAIECIGTDPGDFDPKGLISILAQTLAATERLLPLAREAELDATEAAAERLLARLNRLRDEHEKSGALRHSEIDLRSIKGEISQLTVTAIDQLQMRHGLALSAREKALFDAKDPLFGPDVEAKFSDARDDIEEAGKCLALGRNKACVCHLMLAMEEALRVLATKASVTTHDDKGKWLPWLMLANNLEHQKIKPMPEGEEKNSWWEVHSMLSSVGRAWRNPTMHPARSYDGPQAQKVFDAVKGFMSDLAALV